MPADPLAAVERIAQELLGALAELSEPPTLRVAGASGRVAWLVQVWDAARVMPTAAAERQGTGVRVGCRADVLAVVRATMARALRRVSTGQGMRNASRWAATAPAASARIRAVSSP